MALADSSNDYDLEQGVQLTTHQAEDKRLGFQWWALFLLAASVAVVEAARICGARKAFGASRFQDLLTFLEYDTDFSSTNVNKIVMTQMEGQNERDEFGFSVDISKDGSTIIAGARQHDGSKSGYARVFRLVNGGNDLEQLGSDITSQQQGDSQFGHAVSIAADGSVIAVSGIRGGAEQRGYVGVFRWDEAAGEWRKMGQNLQGKQPLDLFGNSLSLSGDGQMLAVGAIQACCTAGYTSVLKYDPIYDQWRSVGGDITGKEAQEFSFGWDVSLSVNPTGVPRIAVGTPGNGMNGESPGHVQVFQLTKEETWSPLGTILRGDLENDGFGASIALSREGECIAVGAPQQFHKGRRSIAAGFYTPGYARVLCLDDKNEWTQIGRDIVDEETNVNLFGFAVDLSADGRRLSVSSQLTDKEASTAGQVQVFQMKGVSWAQLGETFRGGSGDRFGFSLAMSGDSTILVGGAPRHDNGSHRAGKLRVFHSRKS